MTTVDAYSVEKLDPINNNAIVGASVVGDNLILAKSAGGTVNAGNVKGPSGAPGSSGEVTNAQVSAEVGTSSLGFTAWVDATLAANWAVYGGAWPNPRYRRNGFYVELNGMMRWNSTVVAQGQSRTLFTLPTGFRPVTTHQVVWGCRVGRYPAHIRVDTDGTVSVVTNTTYPALTTNDWIFLSSMRFVIP